MTKGGQSSRQWEEPMQRPWGGAGEEAFEEWREGKERDRIHGHDKESGCYSEPKGRRWKAFLLEAPDWGLTPAAWISESSWDTEDLTLAGKEKRRNKVKKKKKSLFRRQLSRSHRKRSHNSKRAALSRNLHMFPELFPQPGSRRKGASVVTTLSISILLGPNTEKDISKTFKNNSQTTQG